VTRSQFAALFRHHKPLIGILHLPALPGSPAGWLSLPAVLSRVLRDAVTLTSPGMRP
jgi:predicted TIM-barrel enzyme